MLLVLEKWISKILDAENHLWKQGVVDWKIGASRPKFKFQEFMIATLLCQRNFAGMVINWRSLRQRGYPASTSQSTNIITNVPVKRKQSFDFSRRENHVAIETGRQVLQPAARDTRTFFLGSPPEESSSTDIFVVIPKAASTFLISRTGKDYKCIVQRY